MCIRAPFAAAIADAVATELELEADYRPELADLVGRLPDYILAHPLALTRYLVKDGFVDEEFLAHYADLVAPIARGFKRVRERNGDLFAGTPHALGPLSKPILAPGYARLAAQQRRDAKHAEQVMREDEAATQALIARARAGVDRFNARNVVDLVALRARAPRT